MFQSKEIVFLLGYFNARVGKSDDVDNIIGVFGEYTCNSNGTSLIELLQNNHLIVFNGRALVSDPQWTPVQII